MVATGRRDDRFILADVCIRPLADMMRRGASARDGGRAARGFADR